MTYGNSAEMKSLFSLLSQSYPPSGIEQNIENNILKGDIITQANF